MGYDREKRLVLVSPEESGRISSARIRYESVTEAGKRKDLGCMDGIETDKEELRADMARWEEAVTIRQENYSGASSRHTFVTESEHRKASELEETIRLAED